MTRHHPGIRSRALAALLLLPLSACQVQAVRPWERGNLAKPVMVRDPGTQYNALVEHFHASKETTSGGYGLGAGGCGCN